MTAWNLSATGFIKCWISPFVIFLQGLGAWFFLLFFLLFVFFVLHQESRVKSLEKFLGCFCVKILGRLQTLETFATPEKWTGVWESSGQSKKKKRPPAHYQKPLWWLNVLVIQCLGPQTLNRKVLENLLQNLIKVWGLKCCNTNKSFCCRDSVQPLFLCYKDVKTVSQCCLGRF